jgi:hypothetical protein
MTLAYLGLDESGSLPDASQLFTMAGILTYRPEAVSNLVRRTSLRSGKRLRRPRRSASEFKWSNSSRWFRLQVLERLAEADVELFALTVRKAGRRIEDTPGNFAILVCELLRTCWTRHPSMALAIDRHFTSPTHVAVFDTFLYRRWPAMGVLSISHVDSQRNPLVQLADFVAGSVQAWHKERDEAFRIIEPKISAVLLADWAEIKRGWSQGPK